MSPLEQGAVVLGVLLALGFLLLVLIWLRRQIFSTPPRIEGIPLQNMYV